MKTVGEILKEARLAKGYTLDNIEQATKIRKKFLMAIEADDYTILPSISYAKGFVKNYGQYLNLNIPHLMAFFRRQTTEVPRSSLLPKGMANPLNSPLFRLTPSRFISLIIGVLVFSFILYFGLQYARIKQPPSLILDSPKADITVMDNRIDVMGKTDSDATVAINGVGVLIRTDGKFFDQVSLESGLNVITVVATSKFGKTTKILRNVNSNQTGN